MPESKRALIPHSGESSGVICQLCKADLSSA